MINLVPPIVRKEIIKEYWVRVISVFLFIASIVSLCALLFILPSYVLLSGQVGSVTSSAEMVKARMADYDLSAGALVKANVRAQKIYDLREVDKFSEIFEQVLFLNASGIVIEGFDFVRKDKLIDSIQISGAAETRQSLADFREELLEQKNIKEVVLPISNLAKDKDIEFTMSVVLEEIIPVYE